jgi:hypothetical protein
LSGLGSHAPVPRDEVLTLTPEAFIWEQLTRAPGGIANR